MMKLCGRTVLPLLLALLLPALVTAQISVNVSVNTPPPELPVYDQPPVPGDGYAWTPGYCGWTPGFVKLLLPPRQSRGVSFCTRRFT